MLTATNWGSVMRYRNRTLMAIIIAGSLTMTPYLTKAQENDPSSKMQTVAGVLQVKEDAKNGGRAVFLNNKTIDGEGLRDDHIRLVRKFSIGGRDVVLVRNQCGGSGCRLVSYTFLTIPAKGTPIVSKELIIGDEGEPKIEFTQDNIFLTTVEHDGRRSKTTVWVYSDGKVTQQRR